MSDNLTVSERMSVLKLPKFKNPPVVETVLGVQFEPLPKLSNAHLGAFWKDLGGDWPNVSDVHPLEPQFERFGKAETWRPAGLQLKLSEELNTRLQIRNDANNRMIQVQNGRLHYNWLGHSGGEYPSYERVKPEFYGALKVFRQFLTSVSLGDLRPNQWEITYVNHIPKGTVWNEPKDWGSLFQSLTPLPAGRPPVRLESFGGEWHYEIEPEKGRLHVKLTHGWRREPAEQEMLVLNLTARGPVQADERDLSDLERGLSCGHEAIVKAFENLTSDKAHQYWELIK